MSALIRYDPMTEYKFIWSFDGDMVESVQRVSEFHRILFEYLLWLRDSYLNEVYWSVWYDMVSNEFYSIICRHHMRFDDPRLIMLLGEVYIVYEVRWWKFDEILKLHEGLEWKVKEYWMLCPRASNVSYSH